MEVTVSSRHAEVSDLLRASATEKIGRLGRFLEGMDHAEVHFAEHRNKRNADKSVCEVTLEGHGHHVRCKVSAPDAFAAGLLATAALGGRRLEAAAIAAVPPAPRRARAARSPQATKSGRQSI